MLTLKASMNNLYAAISLLFLLPNPKTTPGAIDPTKTKDILCSKLFRTESIRPPSEYTERLKKDQMKAWHLEGKPSDYEEDHLISLELGGYPTDPRNLWPQRYPYAKWKDKLEDRLHELVCKGKVPLEVAQKRIAENWVEAYEFYIGPLPVEKTP